MDRRFSVIKENRKVETVYLRNIASRQNGKCRLFSAGDQIVGHNGSEFTVRNSLVRLVGVEKIFPSQTNGKKDISFFFVFSFEKRDQLLGIAAFQKGYKIAVGAVF